MQRANRHHVVFLVPDFVDELVSFFVGGRGRTLTVIHAVFTQRIEFVRPVIRQHQTALVRQADRDQAVHVAHFALAPYRSRYARGNGRELWLIGVHFHAHGQPAAGALLHRQHVVHGIAAAELAFVIAKQHRQPAALLVVQELDHFRQVVNFHRHGDLVFGLPGFIQHYAREGLMQGGKIVLTNFFFRHGYSLQSRRQQGDES